MNQQQQQQPWFTLHDIPFLHLQHQRKANNLPLKLKDSPSCLVAFCIVSKCVSVGLIKRTFLFYFPGSRGFYTIHARFGGSTLGLLGRREHPRASQAGYRCMTTQNHCSTVQYGEGSLGLIRLSPLCCQTSPHACPACRPSPNRFGCGYSPARTLRGKFAYRGTRSILHCQPTTLMPSLLRCTGQSAQNEIVDRASADNPKSMETKYMKIRRRRRVFRYVIMSRCSTNVIVAAARRGSA